MLLAAVSVAVVGIIGAAAYVFVLKPKPAPTLSMPMSGSSMAASPQSSTMAACTKALGQFCHIETAADDPAPLTVTELYPKAFSNPKDKQTYSLVADKTDTTCTDAVIDASTSNPVLASALKAGKCKQVVRASYVTSDGKLMGTIGVANLTSTSAAQKAGKLVGQNDFVAPLMSKTGVAAKLGNGTGLIEADLKGHYLIMIWAEYVNGTNPTTAAQDAPLKQFSSDLVQDTANNALDARLLTGTPASGGGV
jgi:hypothetical protein